MDDLKKMFHEKNEADLTESLIRNYEAEAQQKNKKMGFKNTGGLPSIHPNNNSSNFRKTRGSTNLTNNPNNSNSTNNLLTKEQQDKNKNDRPAQKWVWSPFSNPARTDNETTKFSHWQRQEDIDKDYEYSHVNVKINIVHLTKEEYDKYSLYEIDNTWSWEETNYLWDLCLTYDLRFIVIHDRYNYTNSIDRSLEELKGRYYIIAKRILESRKNFDHPILKTKYDYEQELKRRACLERIINKPIETQKLEKDLIEQGYEIKQKIDKLEKQYELEDKLKEQVSNVENYGTGTFEDFIKRNNSENTSFTYLRSHKMSYDLPINEKIQKKIEYMMKEMSIPENLIPTEKVENMYDVLRNNLIIMTSLKKHLEKKEFEKKKMEQTLVELQSKISHVGGHGGGNHRNNAHNSHNNISGGSGGVNTNTDGTNNTSNNNNNNPNNNLNNNQDGNAPQNNREKNRKKLGNNNQNNTGNTGNDNTSGTNTLHKKRRMNTNNTTTTTTTNNNNSINNTSINQNTNTTVNNSEVLSSSASKFYILSYYSYSS